MAFRLAHRLYLLDFKLLAQISRSDVACGTALATKAIFCSVAIETGMNAVQPRRGVWSEFKSMLQGCSELLGLLCCHGLMHDSGEPVSWSQQPRWYHFTRPKSSWRGVLRLLVALLGFASATLNASKAKCSIGPL